MDGDRDRALALLKATHQFPVEYHLSVITRHEETVFVELRAAVEAGPQGPLADDAYQRVPVERRPSTPATASGCRARAPRRCWSCTPA